MARLFEIGDRVRVRTSRFAPVGAVARVTLVLVSVRDMYFVQFDGEDRPILMRGDDLELVTDAPADESAR